MNFMEIVQPQNRTVSIKAAPPLQKTSTPKDFAADVDPQMLAAEPDSQQHRKLFVQGFSSGHLHGRTLCPQQQKSGVTNADTFLQMSESPDSTDRLTEDAKHQIFERIEEHEEKIVKLAQRIEHSARPSQHLGRQETADIETASAMLQPFERALFNMQGPSQLDIQHLMAPAGPKGVHASSGLELAPRGQRNILDIAPEHLQLGESVLHKRKTEQNSDAEKAVYKIAFLQGLKHAKAHCGS